VACALLGIPLLLAYLGVVGSCLASAARTAAKRATCASRGENNSRSNLRKSSSTSLTTAASTAKATARSRECCECRADRELCVSDGHGAVIRARSGTIVESDVRFPWWPCLLALLLYVTFSAWTFASVCGWTIVDALFFCFTVLATIGLPDTATKESDEISFYASASPLISRDNATAPLEQGSFLFLTLCTMYLLSGLALVSACFQLLTPGRSLSTWLPCSLNGPRMRPEEELLSSIHDDDPS